MHYLSTMSRFLCPLCATWVWYHTYITAVISTYSSAEFSLIVADYPFLCCRNRTSRSTDVYHFTVLGTPGHYYAKTGLTFNRIIDLLEHYRTNDYENHLDIANIRLMHPLNRHDYVNAYSYASVEGRFENLLAHLQRLDEETGEEMCECGMVVREAILPNGWMIHQTPDTPKRLFFQHNELNLTQWEIPQGLWGKISPNQRRLLYENGISPS